jgi:hypothetical protein
MAASTFDKIIEDRLKLPNSVATKESIEWYKNMAEKVLKSDTTMLSEDTRVEMVNYVNQDSIGRLYSFFYEAKHKDKLPYWDRHPLIFVIDLYADGFLGMNLHYLPRTARVKLMSALYDTINNKNYDNSTKLNISYRILNGTSRFSGFNVCVKRYLYTHVRSKFMYISPNQWDKAALLPTESFFGASASGVHAQSLKRMR